MPQQEQSGRRAPQKASGPLVLVALAATALGAGAYSMHEHSIAQTAMQQNAQMVASLRSTKADVQELTEKLDAISASKPLVQVPTMPTVRVSAKPAARVAATQSSESESAASTPAPAKVKHTAQLHRQKVAKAHADDPRWKQMQSRLDEQGKALDSTRQDLSANRQDINSTRQDLTAAKTELGDSIARTHGELVVLQRKGERNYYEFNIDKSKQYKALGPIGIRLRKSNEKHQYADLEIMVDDRSLTKKHVNLYEPVMFYTSDSEQPAQIVLNSVTKNHIRGYVSEPKFRASQLTAMSDDKPRQKLPAPK